MCIEMKLERGRDTNCVYGMESLEERKPDFQFGDSDIFVFDLFSCLSERLHSC